MSSRKRPTAAFIGVLIFGFVLYFAMSALQPNLGNSLFDYNTWLDKMRGSPLWSFLWMLGDATEPHFHKSLLGGIGVLAGSVIAYLLDRKGSRFRMTPISYGFGQIWP